MMSIDEIRRAVAGVPRDVRDYVEQCLHNARPYEATRALAEHVGAEKAQAIVASLVREGGNV
jgi:hypothetical protein